MKVIILAGGVSRRMWPLLWDKNSIDFFGHPLVFFTLSKVKESGIDEVVLVGNENNAVPLKRMGESLGLKTKVVVQDKNLKGQGGALLSAKEHLKGEVLVCNANDFYDQELYASILKKVKDSKPDGLLVGYKVKDYFPGGYLKVKDGQVLAVVEKPAPDKVPSDMVRIVADYFARGEDLVKSLEKIKADPDRWYEEAIDQLIKKGKKVVCLPYQGVWKVLKFPWHILDLMKYFFDREFGGRVSKKAQISQKAVIDGNVVIEDNARIFEGAIIRGPAYIGKNALIGNYAIVRESIIEEGSVVGFASEITRSYIGKNCWFHTNYVGDSIIGDNVSFGSGAITANLRLDEEEVKSEVSGQKIGTGRDKLGAIIGQSTRIGINAMIMPGVKIGRDSLVGPGVILSKDLPDGSFCTIKREHEITKNRMTTAKSREKFRKKL